MAEPTIQQVSHELRAACMRVSRRVRVEASSLPPHQVAVLAKVNEQPRTAAELAELELVSAPSMSRTIGELEAAGLISRETSPDDRRQRIVTITGAGIDIIDEIRSTRDYWMVERVEACTDEERAILVQATALLNRMVSHPAAPEPSGDK
ncbi:MarR family winged helix-turn-helix transcriptional regulator [Propionibacteriaceae bacterium G1746]|uniref:MarR family winged helix-turn-helix transcriptional regulator n=1 Tax=Aestuariimicrobium sp. G57 TaxID=3418485 RepID=UPI003C15749F